ncbi:uncharacterized protein LOC114312302 [Camellia sinensis]|uniref:uncharacterized protein LOC114312302 n=1 Tax=Camellia sinensis TaxID=4442 RepID=UPI001036C393|nr:uncharacterized protein LOC114312302 [Camellia sinensis]
MDAFSSFFESQSSSRNSWSYDSLKNLRHHMFVLQLSKQPLFALEAVIIQEAVPLRASKGPSSDGLQQKYTQSGGRPFVLSTLIVGFDPHTGVPSLYQTDPSGTFSAWKANATGRNSNSMREFLEKNYKETSGQETVKLAIRALLGVVESGGKNIEVAVMTKEHGLRQLEEEEIDAIVAEIEAAKDAAEATNNAKKKDSAVEGSSSGGVTANQSERKPSNLSRRDGNQRPSKMDFEVPPTEHVPRVLPKDEDPSLVNRNKSMLGQLLGTLEREIYYITFSILKYSPLKTIITFSTAQTLFILYI